MNPAQGLLKCAAADLNLATCLRNGQSFRWHKLDCTHSPGSSDAHSFLGVALGRVWLLRRVDEESVEWKCLHTFTKVKDCGEVELKDEEDHESALRRYFQLDVDTRALYTQWAEKDEHFRRQLQQNGEHLRGIRILGQEPLETILAFICSANNHVARISKMVNRLAQLYGQPAPDSLLAHLPSHLDPQQTLAQLHSFPDLPALLQHADGMEKQLRTDGFGYRAGYLQKTVRRLSELGGRQWFQQLQDPEKMPTEELRGLLRAQLAGVGPKVADCICLMAFRRHEVVPVDTHILHSTARFYLPDLGKPGKQRGPATPQEMRRIAHFYLQQFGPHAGWAQSVLFTAELAGFQKPQKSVNDISEPTDEPSRKKSKQKRA